MSSLTLEVKFIDMYESMEIEFTNLSGVLGYLNRQRESDYEWLRLDDYASFDVIDGWSAIHQYIRDNTGVDTSDLSQCGDACNCIKCNPVKIKPVRDIPTYMFAERPVTPSTWLEITSTQLDTYMLSDGTALLVDPQNREYCYVFWDEGEQCSNPYPNHAEALTARTVYIANL